MRSYPTCMPCLLSQAVNILESHSDDASLKETTIREVLNLLATEDHTQPPPVLAWKIHDILREATGVVDFFEKDKRLHNSIALELLPMLRERVEAADDPFTEAVKIAIIGNSIDLGIYHTLSREQMESAINDLLTMTIDPEPLKKLQDQVQKAGSILYLADNAGEIVFDRLIIETLPRDKVVLSVKGSPVLNDAMREDAEQAGLDKLVPVIDNGSNVPGTWLDDCSDSFRQTFDKADLIIAKGQGNFETLEMMDKNICFLVLIKCPSIGEFAGVPVRTPAVLWATAHDRI